MKKSYLYILFLFLFLEPILSQIDFKIEHIYDSVSIQRIQLPKSRRIVYLGREFIYDSLKNIKDVDFSKIRIYDENHHFLKIVESKYPLKKDPQYIYTNTLVFHSEDKNGKILFSEMIQYPYDFRIIDEDNNIAQRDSTVDFLIDSFGISPKALKITRLPQSQLSIQYYSYPSFTFEKEYIVSGVDYSDYQHKIFRRNFDSIGEKLVLSTDTAIFLINNDHTIYKTIKPFVPPGYIFAPISVNISQKLINNTSDLFLNYDVISSSQFWGCYETRIKSLLTTVDGTVLRESYFEQSIGPPENHCNGNPTRGATFNIIGNKIFEHYRDIHNPDTNSLKVINVKDNTTVLTIPDTIGYFKYVENIGKTGSFYVLIRRDSLLFFNTDDNFSLRFKTSDYSINLLSDSLLNQDELIEWFTYGRNGGVVAKNQNSKILFECLNCNLPSFSKINGHDNKLIFGELVSKQFGRTLIYSKNIKTNLIEKFAIKALKIFPNPATDIIKIDMTLDDYGKLGAYQLRIVDIVGKIHQIHPLSNFASIKEISVANMVNGLYFVQLVDSSGYILTSNKIIVSR